MRERRQFTDATASREPFLRFPFLSFELLNGQVSRFLTPDALAAREEAVCAAGYLSQYSEGAAMFWLPHSALTDAVLAAVRRAFQTYYQVCGSREHFIESVSRRYVRDFVREHGRDVTVSTAFLAQIEAECDLAIAIGLQRDQFKHHSVRELSEVIDVQSGSSPLLDALASRPRFLSDLNSSLSKKTTNYGHSEEPRIYYCITTLTDEHFLNAREGDYSEFRLARRAVLIFMSEEKRLRRSSIQKATRLIDSTLRDRRTASREDPFFDVLEQCRRAEEHLGANPCLARDELDKVIVELLTPFLRKIAEPTSLAEYLVVRRFDPSTGTLTRLVETGPVTLSKVIPSLSLEDRQYGAVRAFVDDEPVWQAHEHYYREHRKSTGTRPELRNSVSDDRDAYHARSIRVGSVPSAVIEFTSSRVERLKTESAYFERVATMCGEVIRRVELANDRAWLSRMSYVHAARHRIESIIRQIGETAGEPASQLRELLSSYSVVQSMNHPDTAGAIGGRVDALKAMVADDLSGDAERVCKDIARACDTYHAPDRAFALVREILETLTSNASHAPFDLGQLEVEVLQGVAGASTLKLVYQPHSGIMAVDRLAQVCVSPIRDEHSATFHFGLFLLAAQLRMIGGAARSAAASDAGLGHTHYGTAFMVPLGFADEEG